MILNPIFPKNHYDDPTVMIQCLKAQDGAILSFITFIMSISPLY